MDEGLLNDLLECSVCLERLDTSSRVLPCQHTFCLQCLREILYAQKELRCPECRILVETPVEELPPNVLLMRILEGMRNSGGRKVPSTSPPRRPGVGALNAATEPVSSYGFTYADEDGKHTNVIPECTPHARACFDYLSEEPGDLNFKKGEVIILRRQIDAYWYHGEIGGIQGAFPIAYAKIVVPLPPPLPQCTALYDFRMAAPDEEGCLAFNKGAVVNVIRRVDENWAEGRLHDKIGIFPIAFVEMNAPALAIINTPADVQNVIDRNVSSDRTGETTPRSVPGCVVNKSSQSTTQKHNIPQRVLRAPNQLVYRQQAALVSPMPDVGAPVRRQQPDMSQSHPVYAHRRPFHGTREVAPAISTFVDAVDPRESTVVQLRNLQLDCQGSERANAHRAKQTNLSFETPGRSGSARSDPNIQNSDKAKTDAAKYSDLTSSYHSANNLNSDSSSATTTLSFSGGSATTAPNTSSSNSTSESNSPSSPASPASNVNRPKSNILVQNDVSLPVNQNYCSAIPQNAVYSSSNQKNVVHGNSSREENDVSNTSICDVSGSNISTPATDVSSGNLDSTVRNVNSSVQNVNGNIVNATPPRSNVSSPQICLGNSNIMCNINNAVQSQPSDGVTPGSLNKISCPSQNVIDSVNQSANMPNMILQPNPFLNVNNIRCDGQSMSGKMVYYKLTDQFSNEHNVYNVISPRHGGKDIINVPRLSHSHHHREKEKRHSLTPVGQNLIVTHSSLNRHSAEILGTTSAILLDKDLSQDVINVKHSDKEKRTEKDKQEKDVQKSKEKSKKLSNIDKSLPMTYVALYPYKPQKPDELELKKGGLYMVLEQCQDGWFKGCSSRSKKSGVFPGNYVAPASKNVQLASGSSSKNKHVNQISGNDVTTSSPGNSKSKDASSSGFSKKTTNNHAYTQAQPPDLPPRSQSPGASQIFAWSSPKCSSSKSSEKKEKSKSEKNSSSGVSLMKRLTGMKKSRSPPPSNNAGFSMDNPVFEDCVTDNYSSVNTHDAGQVTQSTIPQHPVHIRSGSCPSQLLQGAPVSAISSQSQNLSQYTNESMMIDNGIFGQQLAIGGSVSSAVAHRLFPSYHAMKGSGSQTLGPSHGLAQIQRRQPRPTVLNSLTSTPDTSATLCLNSNTQGFSVGRTSGDVSWLPTTTRHHHHRKSHSLDAGQQLRSGKENSNQPIGKRFRCIVAYPPNSEYELELQVNDVVLVHKKLGEGWYKGTLERTGHTGLVPASFVEAC